MWRAAVASRPGRTPFYRHHDVHILHICIVSGKHIPMGLLPHSDRLGYVPVHWMIRPLLERHNISTYRLMRESGLAQGTVYRLVNGETQSLNVETLDRVMAALQRLTGERLEISDLLRYDEPNP